MFSLLSEPLDVHFFAGPTVERHDGDGLPGLRGVEQHVLAVFVAVVNPDMVCVAPGSEVDQVAGLFLIERNVLSARVVELSGV